MYASGVALIDLKLICIPNYFITQSSGNDFTTEKWTCNIDRT